LPDYFKLILKKLGLTENEIKIYLVCLALGNTLVGSIAKKTDINRTTAYATTESLAKKGFLTSHIRNKIKYYAAIEPELLIEKCQTKIRNEQKTLTEISSIIPMLKELQGVKSDFKVEFLQGVEGINLFQDKIVLLNKTIYTFEDSGETYFNFSDSAKTLIRKRLEKGIKNRVICPKDTPYNFNSQKELREVRYIDEQVGNNIFKGTIAVCGSIVGIYSLKKHRPSIICIENEDIATYFRLLFDLVWNLLGSNSVKVCFVAESSLHLNWG
jgi:sugar-specific transcriptional regulator TrmB